MAPRGSENTASSRRTRSSIRRSTSTRARSGSPSRRATTRARPTGSCLAGSRTSAAVHRRPPREPRPQTSIPRGGSGRASPASSERRRAASLCRGSPAGRRSPRRVIPSCFLGVTTAAGRSLCQNRSACPTPTAPVATTPASGSIPAEGSGISSTAATGRRRPTPWWRGSATIPTPPSRCSAPRSVSASTCPSRFA